MNDLPGIDGMTRLSVGKGTSEMDWKRCRQTLVKFFAVTSHESLSSSSGNQTSFPSAWFSTSLLVTTTTYLGKLPLPGAPTPPTLFWSSFLASLMDLRRPEFALHTEDWGRVGLETRVGRMFKN